MTSKTALRSAIAESTKAYGLILADIASFPKGWADPLVKFESNVKLIAENGYTDIQARCIAVCMFAQGYHGQDPKPYVHSAPENAIYDFAKAWRENGYKMDGDTICAVGVASCCLESLMMMGWARYKAA